MRRYLIATGAACLLLCASAQAHPIPLKAVERAALTKAYTYWHGKPCSVRYRWGTLPPGTGTFGDPASCSITLSHRAWSHAVLWHLRRDRYRHRRDYLALAAPDPYAVETWQDFCADAVTAVGGMLGHAPTSNPHSAMFLGALTYLNGVPRFCGTSPLGVHPR